jgi:hypothetical protein
MIREAIKELPDLTASGDGANCFLCFRPMQEGERVIRAPNNSMELDKARAGDAYKGMLVHRACLEQVQ